MNNGLHTQDYYGHYHGARWLMTNYSDHYQWNFFRKYFHVCETWYIIGTPWLIHWLYSCVLETVDLVLFNILLPGADHILAQPLKRCSATRIKPNETFELAKKRQRHTLVLGCENTPLFWGVETHPCFGVWKHTLVLGCENIPLFWGVETYPCYGVCERKNFSTLSPSYKKSPKNHEKSPCPTVLQLRWVISTWRDEMVTLFVFSACYKIHWNWFCGIKQTKMQRLWKGAFFREGCFDAKEDVSNTANKRSSRQVLQFRCSLWYSNKFYTQR